MVVGATTGVYSGFMVWLIVVFNMTTSPKGILQGMGLRSILAKEALLEAFNSS